MAKHRLYQITSPSFCAGLVIATDSTLPVRLAPILHFMRDWPLTRIERMCHRKKWTLIEVREVRATPCP